MAVPEILLIDDNKQRLHLLETVLKFMECTVIVASGNDYQLVLSSNDLDAIFIGCSDSTQTNVIKELTLHSNGTPVFLVIDKDQPQSQSNQAMLAGVLEWPTVYPKLLALLNSIPQASETNKKPQTNKGLAGQSKAIQKIRDLINQVAKSDATVLILGESGTGKEVVAQALHRSSTRRDKPFVPVNCGAIPGELLESELFGHEKGAFTGAFNSRQGRFEMAEGGTLFLDEIGDMPMPMQVKLLRVLQERTFERVGSNKTVHCNVRVIAATHRQLEQEIIEKRFREDLYYRLNVFPIEIPPLRDRIEDIPFLINDLLAKMTVSQRGNIRLTQKAIALLMQHQWPGNVRELSNLIERIAITHPDGTVDANDLPEKFQAYTIPDNLPTISVTPQWEETNSPSIPLFKPGVTTGNTVQLPEQGIDLKEYLTDLENELIRQALDECNGVVAHAAKLLNMRRTTLVEKLRKVDV
ncbi:sigma-54 dependent transcriptional regulator [Methylomonas sp. AM2-LC]|uniref:sigma-54 dependent transcriptional regulator n=1 Tax=Methylomonas sp. AM2-LC TaxID=3153301 RepID=UPI00326646ED